MTASNLQPGAIFGRDFRIVKPLRAGGMGAVYVVEQLSTGKERALKIMAPELAHDPATRERFVFEARAASKIESDHVVEIVIAGVDEETGAPYLVMELLRGEELADALERTGPLPIGDVAEVLAQVGHALEQAHTHGIVHRDLKPENIFLGVSKRRDTAFTAKILDFGIAKLVEDSQKTGTQPLGTPLFMSPEQTDRQGKISPGTDVWALGLIAFLMLTGKDYWRQADGSLPQLLREICIDPIESAHQRATELGVGHHLPPGFDAWFAGCVNRQPEARYVNAGDAVRAFVSNVAPPGARATVLSVSQSLENAGGGAVGAMQSGSLTGMPYPGSSSTGAAGHVSSSGPTVIGGPMGTTTPAVSATAPVQSGGSGKIAYAAIPLVLGGLLAGGWFFFIRADESKPTAPVPAMSASGTTAPSANGAVADDLQRCPENMILESAGKMIMGAKDGSEDAKVTHKVQISEFCLDRTEVTVDGYGQCVGAGECEKSPKDIQYPGVTAEAKARYSPLCNSRHSDRQDHPINCVDWNMADAFCKWRKARLPTEAEWEFAARGSRQRDYPWGDQVPDHTRLNGCGAECAKWGEENGQPEMATMFPGDDKFFATAPVGSYPDGASAQGVLDLAGNVWEWTSDWYAVYSPDDQTDPSGPDDGDEKVVRGGAFNGSMKDWAKPSYRWKSAPTTYNHAIGFRCAAVPTGPVDAKPSDISE